MDSVLGRAVGISARTRIVRRRFKHVSLATFRSRQKTPIAPSRRQDRSPIGGTGRARFSRLSDFGCCAMNGHSMDY